MDQKTAAKKHVSAFLRSAKLIYQADRKNAFFLLLLAPLQGLAPIFCAFFVSRILEALTQPGSTVGRMAPLLVGWGLCTLLNYILSPLSLFLQGELTDKLSNCIHCSVFDKTAQIEDMKTAESAAFQDEMQVLQNEVSFRPVNLIFFRAYCERVYHSAGHSWQLGALQSGHRPSADSRPHSPVHRSLQAARGGV
ncbi:MAG TPA: hypothetical protein IAC31_09575 [Candidatus Faecousia intestinigallinarum]|nr:hypothetical protein [Candidatus Faecousia intestinigallinarum]